MYNDTFLHTISADVNDTQNTHKLLLFVVVLFRDSVP